LNNIIVRKSNDGNGKPYQLISGFRRMTALKAALSENGDFANATVPARILDAKVSNDEAYRISFTENLARKDLSVWEIAKACSDIEKQMSAAGIGKTEIDDHIAGLLQKHPRTVRRYLKLATIINEDLADAVHNGSINYLDALEIGENDLDEDDITALLVHLKKHPKPTRAFKQFYENLEYCCECSEVPVSAVLECKNADEFLSLENEELFARVEHLRDKTGKEYPEILNGEAGSLVKPIPAMDAEANKKSFQDRFAKASKPISSKAVKAFKKSKIDAELKIKPMKNNQVALTISAPVDQIRQAIKLISGEIGDKLTSLKKPLESRVTTKKTPKGLGKNKNWKSGFHYVSAIQKAVRRCKINLARFYAKQMLELGKPVWLWNRLLIISAEDIGLADPTMVGYVRERYDTFENLRKQKNVEKSDVKKDSQLCDIIDQVVIAEAISYKSRLLPMLSFIALYDIFKYEIFKKDVAVYFDRFVDALDKKDEKKAVCYATIIDTFMGLGHGDRVLSLIEDRSENHNAIFISEWLNEYKRFGERLMLVGSIVLLCRDLSNSHGEYKTGINKHLTEPIVEEEIPDYAYDRHTNIGKKKGRGLKHFFEEAAHVENERFENIYKKTGEQAYLEAERKGFGSAQKVIDKVHEFLIPLPFDYKKVVLTQARTSEHRPYAFVVEFKNGSRKFIKGPFKDKDKKVALNHLKCNDVKKTLESKHLHPIQCEIVEYGPDLIFLECEELGKADLDDVKCKRTNIESRLFTVLNYHSNDIVPNPFKYLTEIIPQNIEIWTAVMVNYCFRWVFGIRDTATRNLVLQKSTGKIYSVDETGIQPGNHEIIWGGNKPKANTFQLIDDFVKSPHFDAVLREVDRWKQYLDLLSSEVGPLLAEVEGRIDKLLNDHIKVFDV
jgi:ParB-like chromosome segregation protein Spo0J